MVMAYTVMAYIVTAYVVMAYVVMAYVSKTDCCLVRVSRRVCIGVRTDVCVEMCMNRP